MAKIEDLKTRTDDQLTEQLGELKREQFNLRFQAATNQLEKPSRVREVRRTIAQIKTLKSLHLKKGRAETGLFLAEGARLAVEAADLGVWPEILLFSPAALLFPLYDEAVIGRKDVLFFVAFARYAWLMPRSASWSNVMAFVPGAAFYADHGDPRTLRLSFVTASAAQIDTGIAALAATIRQAL